mgnify:CR=1 FL=1
MKGPRNKDTAMRRLAAQYAVAEAVASSRDPREAAARILEGICQALDWQVAAYWEMETGTRLLSCTVFWRSPSSSSQDFEAATCRATLPAGIDLPGRVWQMRRPEWVEDVAKDSRFARAKAAAQDGLHGAFAVPVVLGDEVRGVLEFFSNRVEKADAKMLVSLAHAGVSLGLLMERTRVQEALAQSRAWMRLIVDSTAEAVFTMDLQGHCSLVNPSCLRLLRYEREGDLVGRHLHDLIHHTGADGKFHASTDCPIYEALRTGRGSHSDGEVLWRADGSCFPAEYWSLPLVEDGEVVGSVVTFFDITNRRESERKVNEAVTLKSDFVSMVAHELRSPLTAVKMSIDYVSDGSTGTLADEQRRMLDTAKRNIDRLVRLVGDVLDYQKLDIGKLEFRFKPEDLCRLIRETAEGFALMARRKGVDLRLELPDAPCAVSCDADRIVQVVTNLLSNAVKFTDKGEIRVAAVREGAFVRVAVSDQGIGMRAEDIPKLFKTFTQLPSGREAGGSGLGLALAKRIVEEHGGRLWAESTLGRGATFSFTLPGGR